MTRGGRQQKATDKETRPTHAQRGQIRKELEIKGGDYPDAGPCCTTCGHHVIAHDPPKG